MKSLSDQMSDQADIPNRFSHEADTINEISDGTKMDSLLKPRERRIYCDEHAFADRATWLDAHQIKEDRRKPRNIVTENNHSKECLKLIAASGMCTCGGEE